MHVEYIPTQIITEYFRTEFVHEGERLDGIRYLSARHADHYSLVLFATQDDLMGVDKSEAAGFGPASDPWIELIDHGQRDVTANDLDQWDREAPQEIEWI